MNDSQQGADRYTAPASTDNNDRKAMIRKGFDTVAPGYDHPSLSFFPETAKPLIEHLDLQPHQHVFYACCGTGVVVISAGGKQ